MKLNDWTLLKKMLFKQVLNSGTRIIFIWHLAQLSLGTDLGLPGATTNANILFVITPFPLPKEFLQV